MNKVCHIIGAGDFSEKEILRNKNDIIIAADGGLKSLENIGITPDFVIGDFDSLHYQPESDNVITLPCEKDITDTQAAIEKGLTMGCNYFKIYGGTGGREEHTIANIQNLVKLSMSGYKGEIIDKNKIITVLHNGKLEFDKNHKGFISVFSHSDKSIGVNETGLKYALSNMTLTNFEPLGVSNEFIGEMAVVEVKNGTLLIIYDR